MAKNIEYCQETERECRRMDKIKILLETAQDAIYKMNSKEFNEFEHKMGLTEKQIAEREALFTKINKNNPESLDGKIEIKTKRDSDDHVLKSFYVEENGECKLYEISTNYKNGYKAISILIDSGASDSVAPNGFFPDIPVYETNASKANLMYTAAGGNKITNEGMCMPKLYSENGKA